MKGIIKTSKNARPPRRGKRTSNHNLSFRTTTSTLSLLPTLSLLHTIKMFPKVVVAASTFALLANAGPCVRQYTVKEGDICDSISATKSVSTYQLAVINHGVIDSSCSNLMPGSTICIGYENEDCSTTYVVKKDDTCDLITSATSIDSTLLWANNPQIDSGCSNLYIGEVLCVAKSVIVPPAPKSGSVPTAIPATATPAAPSSVPKPKPTPANPSDADYNSLPFCDEL